MFVYVCMCVSLYVCTYNMCKNVVHIYTNVWIYIIYIARDCYFKYEVEHRHSLYKLLPSIIIY
jgi:hypothetical protein